VEDLYVNADQIGRFLCLFAELQKQNIIRDVTFSYCSIDAVTSPHTSLQLLLELPSFDALHISLPASTERSRGSAELLATRSRREHRACSPRKCVGLQANAALDQFSIWL
jgi:hypothetical protein